MSWTGFHWDRELPRFLVDVTGDGRRDIVGFGRDGVWVALNNGAGGFAPPKLAFGDMAYNTGWRIDRHPRSIEPLADQGGLVLTTATAIAAATAAPALAAAATTTAPATATGIGRGRIGALPHAARLDLIGFGDAGVYTAAGHGNGTFGPLALAVNDLGFAQGWRVERHVRGFADLTGNGHGDVVGFGDAGVWVARNHGDGSFAAARFVLASFGVQQGWRVDQHPRFAVDLTGDDRADLIGFGDDGVWVARNNGSGGFAPAQLALASFGVHHGWRVDLHPRLLADVTGDGRLDLVGFGDDGVWIARNNGDGSFAAAQLVLGNLGAHQGWRTDRHPRFAVDLTGDGRADLVGFGDDGVWVARNNGNGSFAPAQLAVGDLGYTQGWRVDQHPRMVTDITGDGRADLVGFGDDGVWVARNNGDGSFARAQFVLADFGARSAAIGIEHVFVLMLENRSFDHMLGFSNLTGSDAATGAATAADGLHGTESNAFEGARFSVQRGADPVMPTGPGHEFHDVLVQLAGPGAQFQRGAPYPAITGAGYVASYAEHGGRANLGEIMKCFTPEQLPVINALAREFAVCDRWFSSLPGPTWPNRMFMHAASSAGLDDSPSNLSIGVQEEIPFAGFEFPAGTIFHALDRAKLPYRVYAGDGYPMVASLDGVGNIHEFEDFARDLHQPEFAAVRYVHIEPSYDVFNDYRDGTSQHPLADVSRGEALIKTVYEAIRSSPLWSSSVLVITWDEHGGFFDHVAPPAAPPPRDPRPEDNHNQHGFAFDRYGPRVPALVISPHIARNVIDHRIYDHASIPAMIERVFGLSPLTERDALANAPTSLLTLPVARGDAPLTVGPAMAPISRIDLARVTPLHPEAPIEQGHVAAFLAAAAVQDLELSGPAQRAAILARVNAIRTHAEAHAYMAEVEQRVAAARRAGTVEPPTRPVRPVTASHAGTTARTTG